MDLHVVPFGVIRGAMERFQGAHSAEVGEGAPEVAWARYERLEGLGSLFCVAASVDSEVLGYYVAVIDRHIHHRLLCATTTLIWLAPAVRRGSAGAKMLKFAESALRDRAVEKVYTGLRIQRQINLFRRLGYALKESVMEKSL